MIDRFVYKCCGFIDDFCEYIANMLAGPRCKCKKKKKKDA